MWHTCCNYLHGPRVAVAQAVQERHVQQLLPELGSSILENACVRTNYIAKCIYMMHVLLCAYNKQTCMAPGLRLRRLFKNDTCSSSFRSSVLPFGSAAAAALSSGVAPSSAIHRKHVWVGKRAPIETLCECENTHPGSLDARLFPCVMLTAAPAATMAEVSSLLAHLRYRRVRVSVCIYIYI